MARPGATVTLHLRSAAEVTSLGTTPGGPVWVSLGEHVLVVFDELAAVDALVAILQSARRRLPTASAERAAS